MADLAILNAKVWTVNRGQPTAEAVAARGQRIIAMGSDAEVRKVIGRRTRVVDAGGRLVLPGFNDAHVHLLGGGFSLTGLDLRNAANEDEFVELLRDHVAGLPKGEWVTGGRWDHEAWPGRKRPTRWLIDPVTPENPVLLRRLDGHIAVANSLALKLAGVTRHTADPPGGVLKRDPDTGEPTGILIDGALALVGKQVAEPTPAQRLRAARAAVEHAAALGVTSVHPIGSAEELRACERLRDEGHLTTRVYAVLHDASAAAGRVLNDPLLRTGAVKMFVDGSLGARSALLFEPYDDDPSTSGLFIHPDEEGLYRATAEAHEAGLQIAMHAIGDRATHLALNALGHAIELNGRRDARHRVEHAQVCRPEDRERFGRLGVIASIQPSHCTDDMRWIERRLGERSRYAYPFRSLLDAGARVAIGTDWPVEPLDPLLTIHAAVTRQFAEGGPPGGWHPEERVTVAEAVEAYTVGSSNAEFQEHQKGAIEVGKLADMAVLSQDLFAIPPGEILNTKVEMTILGGRCIYERTDKAPGV